MAGVVLIWDLGVLDFGSWSFGFGSWFGLWILEFGSLDLGFWILEFRFWILEFRLWILEFWILDLGVWILDDVDVLRKTIPDLWVTSLPEVWNHSCKSHDPLRENDLRPKIKGLKWSTTVPPEYLSVCFSQIVEFSYTQMTTRFLLWLVTTKIVLFLDGARFLEPQSHWMFTAFLGNLLICGSWLTRFYVCFKKSLCRHFWQQCPWNWTWLSWFERYFNFLAYFIAGIFQPRVLGWKTCHDCY